MNLTEPTAVRPVSVASLTRSVLSLLMDRAADYSQMARPRIIVMSAAAICAGFLLASGLHELAEAGVIPESELLLVGAFAALAAPTLYFFFRKPKAAVTA